MICGINCLNACQDALVYPRILSGLRALSSEALVRLWTAVGEGGVCGARSSDGPRCVADVPRVGCVACAKCVPAQRVGWEGQWKRGEELSRRRDSGYLGPCPSSPGNCCGKSRNPSGAGRM